MYMAAAQLVATGFWDSTRHLEADSNEAIVAPLLALCASLLGLALEEAKQHHSLNAKINSFALWFVAIASSYFWYASLYNLGVNETFSHLNILLGLLYWYFPIGLTGFIGSMIWKVIETVRNEAR